MGKEKVQFFIRRWCVVYVEILMKSIHIHVLPELLIEFSGCKINTQKNKLYFGIVQQSIGNENF